MSPHPPKYSDNSKSDFKPENFSSSNENKKSIVKTLGRKFIKSNKAVKGAYSNLRNKAAKNSEDENSQASDSASRYNESGPI